MFVLGSRELMGILDSYHNRLYVDRNGVFVAESADGLATWFANIRKQFRTFFTRSRLTHNTDQEFPGNVPKGPISIQRESSRAHTQAGDGGEYNQAQYAQARRAPSFVPSVSVPPIGVSGVGRQQVPQSTPYECPPVGQGGYGHQEAQASYVKPPQGQDLSATAASRLALPVPPTPVGESDERRKPSDSAQDVVHQLNHHGMFLRTKSSEIW